MMIYHKTVVHRVFFLTAATVEFAKPQYNVVENGVSVTVTLNLTGILEDNTTVRYASAVAGFFHLKAIK